MIIDKKINPYQLKLELETAGYSDVVITIRDNNLECSVLGSGVELAETIINNHIADFSIKPPTPAEIEHIPDNREIYNKLIEKGIFTAEDFNNAEIL